MGECGVAVLQVEAWLDKRGGGAPSAQYFVIRLELLGYNWAQRVINTAGGRLP